MTCPHLSSNKFSHRELLTLQETVRKAESQEKSTRLKDCFGENPRLIITPSNRCSKGCLHCVADSTPEGEVMPYSQFRGIDPHFFSLFQTADFGRRGDPLTYSSEGKNLADLLEFLDQQGIKRFTLALPIHPQPLPIMAELEEKVEQKKWAIETMVTYHHYFPELNQDKKQEQLAKEVNSTLKNYLRFSSKIVFSLLGDLYSKSSPTKAEEVISAYNQNRTIIFSGIELQSCSQETTSYRKRTHLAQVPGKQGKTTEIYLPPLDTRVYPLGRFQKYLAERGILEKYTQEFNRSLSDYVCPDLVRWPGVILEPNGDLNLCASFEAVCCRGAIATNLFTQSYSQTERELLNIQEQEKDWFISHLPEIMEKKISTCRIKNELYGKRESLS